VRCLGPSPRAESARPFRMKHWVPILVLLVVLLGLSVPPVRAAQSGQFVLRCPYSHSLPDDPIVFPGQPGASHLHDFFGNTSVNASSTFETMLAGETNCRVPSDTAGYWAPAGFLNGVQLRPGVMRIYYLAPAATGTPGTIPAGLQMVGGNKEAQSPGENPHVSWSCGQTTSVSTPHRDMPYDCRPWAQYAFVDGIVASIDFPSCWNGIGLRPEDVTYPEGGTCPPGFGNVIPKLSERVHYGVMNPLGPDGTLAFQLSSGPPYTMHADFWNTWVQERLDQLVADCLVAKVHCGSVDASSTTGWVRQFGTQRYDLANAAAPDGKGGSYTAGFTNFSLDGQPYHHRYDAFLTRYDADGDKLWTRQFGTSGTDQALAVSVSGNDVYVVGSTDGRFPRQRARGGTDAFVARFDPGGRLTWLRQFGTHRDDEGAAVSASADAIFLAGTTRGPLDQQRLDGPSDAFVMRLDIHGFPSWTRVFGGDGEDRGLSVAPRKGQVVLAGTTEGLGHTAADQDGFVAGFDRRGRPAWSHPLGASDTDAITSIVPRAEGVYFAGWTSGSFLHEPPAGGFDAVIGKLRVGGGLSWLEQFGSATDDQATALSIAGKGVYVAGSTTGELPDGTPLGESDGFLRKYLPNGTEVWTQQFGTADYDAVYGMASDPNGVVVVGTTHGAFDGQTNAGDRDIFLVKIAFS
jgi:Domain of unknown function (DUF1996)